MKYTLSEFRSKTREAFNAAENNEVVIIERHGVLFELVRYQPKDTSYVDGQVDSGFWDIPKDRFLVQPDPLVEPDEGSV